MQPIARQSQAKKPEQWVPEGVISTALSNETSRATSAESSIMISFDGKLATETSRATAVEKVLREDIGRVERETTRNTANISRNKSRIDENRSGIAITAAIMAAIQDPINGKNYYIGVSYGNFKDKNSFAFGMSLNLTDNISTKALVGLADDAKAIGVSAGYSW